MWLLIVVVLMTSPEPAILVAPVDSFNNRGACEMARNVVETVDDVLGAVCTPPQIEV